MFDIIRTKIIGYLRGHPKTLNFFWKALHFVMNGIAFFVPVDKKMIIFASFGGRQYSDSPKAIYNEICKRGFFDDWKIKWAFVNPASFEIPRGRKVKIDTPLFFFSLMRSGVWISNSGMDRNIRLNKKRHVRIETWHGSPIKRIGSDQKVGTLGGWRSSSELDDTTIRCAQSEYDRNIFSKVFNAAKESILLCDLPRNDELKRISPSDVKEIKKKLCLSDEKKVLLYVPTYREFNINRDNQYVFISPINLDKWETALANDYYLLFRSHYAIGCTEGIYNSDFARDVSKYDNINELYAISDVLISDYSSAFFDFSILEKPMLCYAFDYEEYSCNRGLYIDIEKEMPCGVDYSEASLIQHIVELDLEDASKRVKQFKNKYVPNAGNATNIMVDKLIEKIGS